MSQLPVSAAYEGHGSWSSTRVSFEDYGRMHTERHHGNRLPEYIPEFANNSGQLQKVLLVRAWRYAHGGAPIRENANWREVNTAATKRALAGHPISPNASAVQHEMQASHIAAVRRAGGYLQLMAAIAFRSWRLGECSVTVGQSLGISPWNVRAQIHRMRNVAHELGFPVGKTHPTRGRNRVVRKGRRGPHSLSKAARLRAAVGIV